MNRTSPRRSVRALAPCGVLSLVKNHRQAGMAVLRNRFPGREIMQETRSASTRAVRISPSRTVGRTSNRSPARRLRCRGRPVGDDVLHPGEVGVGLRGARVTPAAVVGLAGPVGHVERRVGQDVVGLEIGQLVVGKGVGPRSPSPGGPGVDGEVHLGQAPGAFIGLLPVDGQVVGVVRPVRAATNLLAGRTCDGSAAGVIHAPS